ncbi:MAG: EamA family transporter [Caldilineaceae bacterium]
MDPKAAPYVVALGLAWGLNLVISRFGISQFDPYVFIGLRLLIASAIFAAIYAFSTTRRWPRDSQLWRSAAIVAIFGTALPLRALWARCNFNRPG